MTSDAASRLLDLRSSWEAGEIDKGDFARAMQEAHRRLEEHVALLKSSRLARLELVDEGLIVESGWAPVRFWLDPGDVGTPVSVSLAFGDYEPVEMELLRELLKSAAVFVDVGANIGWYSLHAKAFGPELEVVAVEPVPSTFEELRRNVELNGDRIVTLQIALGDAPGVATMQVPQGIAGASSLRLSRAYDEVRVERVPVSTLDDLVAERDLRVDVVKIDVEGAELLVVRGALATLRRDRPALIAEMLRIHSASFGYHPNEIIELLRGLGYRCFAAGKRGWRTFEMMDDSTVETDFAFLHLERHADVIDRLTSR